MAIQEEHAEAMDKEEFLSEDHELKPEEMKLDDDGIDADYGDEVGDEAPPQDDDSDGYGDEMPSD